MWLRSSRPAEPVEYEIDYLRKNGSQVPVSITVFAVKGDDGKPTGLAAIVRNLTERKRAEEQFRLVVESSPNGMLMVDKSGTILLVNRQIEQLFGYERAELIGQPVEMLVPQRMRSHHAGDRDEFFAHSEHRAMGKGRDLYWCAKRRNRVSNRDRPQSDPDAGWDASLGVGRGYR